MSATPACRFSAALLGYLCIVGMAYASDGDPARLPSSLEYASGAKVRMVRIGLQSPWSARWYERDGRHWTGYWDLSLAQWRGSAHQEVAGRYQYINDVGLTPVFRYQSDSLTRWYFEAGIGVHVLSQLYDNDYRKLSTRGQFGDHVGLGYLFRNGWDAGIKLQHFSNGGVKQPNNGVNFIVVRLARTL